MLGVLVIESESAFAANIEIHCEDVNLPGNIMLVMSGGERKVRV